jgi:uncharacterized protein YkwD
MAGSSTTGDRKYAVHYLRDDLHLVRKLDLTSLLACSSVPRSESLAAQAVPSDFETEVLDLVNQKRGAKDSAPLSPVFSGLGQLMCRKH